MNLENPNKLKWKQQYIRKYRDLLGISNLKVSEAQPMDNHITPGYLDHIDRVSKQRSQSMKYNDESFQSRNSSYSVNRKLSEMNSTKIYSAAEMNQIIKHAKLCGLLHNKPQVSPFQSQHQPLLEQNRKHFEEVRNLQKSWHYSKIRQQEQNLQFNRIPMEQHYQFKLNHKRRDLNIQRLIQEQKTLYQSNNTQAIEATLSSGQD
ncbi:unnamed protein product (macronuclear) [Paramecium tetraurelia]|uniref:Uncharacterized protein n=1 Tax=Paramecium tetraurelia TaxID=5888 RepID=A0E7W9_PARTE|nr:uncharacterized protein GSPATT00024114001 [Paramecium tetraurelia]CAK91386.1 unnamed protein product [Paramecium tetraurelia]|eukprot:XP_001458783.1 hypothetical protein (macronuclear) [Paramecium tetraurelia strain d4-2]